MAQIRSTFACLLIAGAGTASAAERHAAEYRLTFDAVWSAQTHPFEAFPDRPHFSGLVGAAHARELNLWHPGGQATPGLEDVAERGNRQQMLAEIGAHVDAGLAREALAGPGIFLSPDVDSMVFTVSDRFPLATFVSMIAPSPDWFVGFHDLELFDGGAFRDEVVIDLAPWDAGTRSGPTYLIRNPDTIPHEPIRNIFHESPFNGNGALGTMTVSFERNLTCTADVASPYGRLDLFDVLGYFDLFASGAAAADRDGVPGLDVRDILAFFDRFASCETGTGIVSSGPGPTEAGGNP